MLPVHVKNDHKSQPNCVGRITVNHLYVCAIHTTQPAYLNSVLEHYTPARTLRSSDTNLLSVPRVRTCFGSRGFSVAAPTIWNSLPFDIRNSCSIVSFRRKLKTFYFSTSSHVYCPASLLTPAPQIRRVSRRHCALYKLKLFTYLLTSERENDTGCAAIGQKHLNDIFCCFYSEEQCNVYHPYYKNRSVAMWSLIGRLQLR